MESHRHRTPGGTFTTSGPVQGLQSHALDLGDAGFGLWEKVIPDSPQQPGHAPEAEPVLPPGYGVSETVPIFPLAGTVDLPNNGGSHLLAMVGGNP